MVPLKGQIQINPYYQVSNQGKHAFWRYLATLLVILFLVLAANLIASIVVISSTGTTDLSTITPSWLFLLAMSTFPAALVGLAYGVRYLHQRRFTTLITSQKSFNWQWFWVSTATWFVLSILGDLVLAFVFTPGNYQINFQPEKFVGFALLAILLLPIQISAEEIFFRGYLLQGTARLTRTGWGSAVITSLLFAGLHIANPEVAEYGLWKMMAFYFSIGAMLAWVTWFSGGLEAALGLHLVNNLYAALVVTFPGSALPTPALFSMLEYNPTLGLVIFYIMSVFYILAMHFNRRKSAVPNSEGSDEPPISHR